MKKFINVFLCSFLLIGSVMPLRVFADGATYIEIPANECFQYEFGSNGSSYNGFFHSQIPCRIMFFTYGTNNTKVVAIIASSEVGDLSLKYGNSEGYSASCPTGWGSRSWDYTSRVINGVRYGFIEYNIPHQFPSGVNVLHFDSYPSANQYVYYTYGDGAVDPEPPAPTYTRPANVQYNTRISGSGAAAANNIDRITWDTAVDTNGTELPQNARVQIRAIPGQYTGTTKQDLLTKTYTDFVIDNTKAVQLVDIIASRGVYETKWSEVTAHFNLPFATFYSLIEGDSYWYRNGWIYQIRLQVDDYYSDWVNIYTATGSGVAESDTITNSDTLTQKLVQQIEIINNLNETTTNWYISETEINMEPYEEPGEGEKPWWAYLLEAITNLVDSVVKGITNIVSSLADLAGDIIDGILGLFSFDSFEVDDWSTQQQQIKDNSGMFGQALDFTQSLQQTFEGVEYQEPILHFDGVTIDNVEVIPEQTYNLNDYVESLGLTNFRNLAYLVMDGFIYFSLVLLIIRKLEGIFKK